MDSDSMEQWRTAIVAKFGKKAKQKWSSAAMDFQLVDLGLKPACLFDHWSVTAEDMQDFTLDLLDRGLTQSKVNVVSIGQDVMVYSLARGNLLLAASLDSTCFMDISSSLPCPDVAISSSFMNPGVANEELTYTIDIFSKLCSAIHDICESQDSSSVYDVPITDRLNGSCLFGLLLGYPCVYWFNLSEGDNDCLSGQPLRLFQVRGQKITQAICHKQMPPKNVGQLCKSKNLKDRSVDLRSTTKPHPADRPHVIFSFTVPVNLLSKVENHIHFWFVQWRGSVQWNVIFSEVWLDEETVNPQSVCL